jgi:hypothetical protein
MYTEIVRRPLIALGLVLVVGATPVMGAICALDCDRPRVANTKAACHGTLGASDNHNVRGAAHACGHRHEGVVALVTNSSAREVGSIMALVAPSLTPLVLTPQTARVSMTHGPPGSIARRTTSLNTVLRI